METTSQKIGRLQKELLTLLPMKEEQQKNLDKKIRLEINYNSNHIEGNTLTYGETELLLIFGKTVGKHDIREYQEMKAHDVAFELVSEWTKQVNRPLTEMEIKNLHKILLVEPFWKEAVTLDGQPTRREIEVGAYKKYPNSVRLQNGEIFHYASPDETPIQMGELMSWLRKEEELGKLSAIELAALLHYKFVRIHPFDDGNGRMSRLLMNFILQKNGLPPAIIKSRDKKEYLFALNQADTGDLGAFIEFIARQVVAGLELSIRAAKGGSLEEPDDLQKEIAIWKRGAVIQKASAIHKSDEIVYNLYQAGRVFDMFNDFVKKHEPFLDMFRKVKVYAYKNNGSNGGLEWLDETMDQIVLTGKSAFVEAGEAPEIIEAPDTFLNIWVSINLSEYKYSEKDPFSSMSVLKIEFEPYKYMVRSNDRIFVTKNYDEYLTEEDRVNIVKESVQEVFNFIRKVG